MKGNLIRLQESLLVILVKVKAIKNLADWIQANKL